MMARSYAPIEGRIRLYRTNERRVPNVWSGRTLQENFADLAGAVLHQCMRVAMMLACTSEAKARSWRYDGYHWHDKRKSFEPFYDLLVAGADHPLNSGSEIAHSVAEIAFVFSATLIAASSSLPRLGLDQVWPYPCRPMPHQAPGTNPGIKYSLPKIARTIEVPISGSL